MDLGDVCRSLSIQLCQLCKENNPEANDKRPAIQKTPQISRSAPLSIPISLTGCINTHTVKSLCDREDTSSKIRHPSDARWAHKDCKESKYTDTHSSEKETTQSNETRVGMKSPCRPSRSAVPIDSAKDFLYQPSKTYIEEPRNNQTVVQEPAM